MQRITIAGASISKVRGLTASVVAVAIAGASMLLPVTASANSNDSYCAVEAGPEPTCCICGPFDPQTNRPSACWSGAFLGYTYCTTAGGGCTDLCVLGP